MSLKTLVGMSEYPPPTPSARRTRSQHTGPLCGCVKGDPYTPPTPSQLLILTPEPIHSDRARPGLEEEGEEEEARSELSFVVRDS